MEPTCQCNCGCRELPLEEKMHRVRGSFWAMLDASVIGQMFKFDSSNYCLSCVGAARYDKPEHDVPIIEDKTA